MQNIFIKLTFHHYHSSKVIIEQLTTPQICSYTSLWFVLGNDACIKFSLFSDTDVSHGSSTTHVRCSGIVNDDFLAYLLVNLSVKKFWKSVNIWRSYGQYYSGLFFLTHSVHTKIGNVCPSVCATVSASINPLPSDRLCCCDRYIRCQRSLAIISR